MYAAERFQSRITASSHATKNPDIRDGCPDAVETQVPIGKPLGSRYQQAMMALPGKECQPKVTGKVQQEKVSAEGKNILQMSQRGFRRAAHCIRESTGRRHTT
jgi:hypothetical protein